MYITSYAKSFLFRQGALSVSPAPFQGAYHLRMDDKSLTFGFPSRDPE